MREIKFRAKSLVNDFKSDVKEEDWVKGYYVVLKDGDTEVHYILTGESDLFYGSGTARETFKKYKVDPKTVGQYTGLKDKNGKEIYEGDIVVFHLDNPSESDREIKPAIGVVEYREDGFVVREIQTGAYIHKFDDQEWEEDLEFYNWAGQNFVWEKLEVIGNVYDDKELLED